MAAAQKRKRLARLGRWLLLVPAAELLYLLAANAVIFSGVIQSEASRRPELVDLAWDRAYSLVPGRAHVSGFRLRVQDGDLQFRLTLDSAVLDVDLFALLHGKFHASHVRAEGVSYRMLMKIDGSAPRGDRIAAFAPIEGFSRPALKPDPPPPPATQAAIDSLWTVELEDVEATVRELWFEEYRYLGPARVQGGFELSPVRRLWVGPAQLQFDGGVLSAGEHVLGPEFTALLKVTIAPVELPSAPGLLILRALSASIRLDTPIADLGAAGLYLDGLRTAGEGRLAAQVEIADGRLMPGSSLEAWLHPEALRLDAYRFSGQAHAKLSIAGDLRAPTVLASLRGRLSAPVLDKGAVQVELTDLTARILLEDNDLSQGLGLHALSAALGEARVAEATPITRAVEGFVPVIAPLVLGDGPLIASATAYLTPEYSLVRVKRVEQGDASFEGAAVHRAGGWRGAATGHFGGVPVGFRLRPDKLETVLFASGLWFDLELLEAGIEPAPATRGTAEGGQ